MDKYTTSTGIISRAPNISNKFYTLLVLGEEFGNNQQLWTIKVPREIGAAAISDLLSNSPEERYGVSLEVQYRRTKLTDRLGNTQYLPSIKVGRKDESEGDQISCSDVFTITSSIVLNERPRRRKAEITALEEKFRQV